MHPRNETKFPCFLIYFCEVECILEMKQRKSFIERRVIERNLTSGNNSKTYFFIESNLNKLMIKRNRTR